MFSALNILNYLLAASVVTAFAPSFGSNLRSQTGLNVVTLDGEEIRGEITPLGNFVLVRTKDTLAATGGGILLPDQVREKIEMDKISMSLNSMYTFSDFCAGKFFTIYRVKKDQQRV